MKYFKKEFACNGTVVQHPEYGEVAQLQGDQRNNICSFLVREGLVKKDKLKVCVCARALRSILRVDYGKYRSAMGIYFPLSLGDIRRG